MNQQVKSEERKMRLINLKNLKHLETSKELKVDFTKSLLSLQIDSYTGQ